MPMVLDNINERKYTAARLKALKTIGEAGKLLAVQGNIRYAENAKDFVKIIWKSNYKSPKPVIILTYATAG